MFPLPPIFPVDSIIYNHTCQMTKQMKGIDVYDTFS